MDASLLANVIVGNLPPNSQLPNLIKPELELILRSKMKSVCVFNIRFHRETTRRVDLIGQTIGQYIITEQIGQGGMATVYKALQPAVERYVAIKVLPPHLSLNQTFIKRFQQEAKAIAQLEHPHILPVYDYKSEKEGIIYIVMRYLDSGTLVNRLKKPTDPAKIVRLLMQVAKALDHTHQQGITHRDIKPSNILIDTHGGALLTDFGIAKIMAKSQDLTEGRIIGTATYMSPEQAQGQPVDGRSDIYSLGVILYQVMVGQPPFAAETSAALLYKHVYEPLPRPRTIKPEISQAMEQVIIKVLAKNPADRYQTASEFEQAMQAALPGIDPHPSPINSAPVETDQVKPRSKNRLILSIGGVLIIVACSVILVTRTILEYHPSDRIASPKTATPETVYPRLPTIITSNLS